MSDYKELTVEEVDIIALEYYLQRSAKTTVQDKPIAVFVAAQPGAGKSAAARLAKNELLLCGGYIHVDADVMRDLIPLNGTKPSSDITQKDAGLLANTVRALAVNAKRNFVEEGTFRKPEALQARINQLQALGYRIELLAVATSREESQLGVFQRYEKECNDLKVINPRFVGSEFQDMAMQGFDESIQKCELTFDRARVITRSGQILFDSNSKENAQNSVYAALIAGREMSAEKIVAISEAWKSVKAQAVSRNAPKDYLDEIDRHAKTDHLQTTSSIK
ncbi:hypothetical protein AGMMS50229_10500 [Campylobacterota bacterium]|nr:hypothetical protein AGMMS50229_10500 [Campylobacterota bacterium]